MEVKQNSKKPENLLQIPKLHQGNCCRKAWDSRKQFFLILGHCPGNQTRSSLIIGGFGRCGWMDHWLSDVISSSSLSYATQKCDFSNLVSRLLENQNLLRRSKQVTSCPILWLSMPSKIWNIKIWKNLHFTVLLLQTSATGRIMCYKYRYRQEKTGKNISFFIWIFILTSTCPCHVIYCLISFLSVNQKVKCLPILTWLIEKDLFTCFFLLRHGKNCFQFSLLFNLTIRRK